jgi:hypothetical protein
MICLLDNLIHGRGSIATASLTTDKSTPTEAMNGYYLKLLINLVVEEVESAVTER